MQPQRIGVFAAVAVTYLGNTIDDDYVDTNLVTYPKSGSAGPLGSVQTVGTANANIFMYDIELLDTGTDQLPIVDGLYLHCILSVGSGHPEVESYASRELLGYLMGFYLQHPSQSLVIGPPSQAWGETVTITVTQEPLEQSVIQNFFLAGRTPLQPAIGWRIHVSDQTLVAKKPGGYPPGWPAPSASPKFVITGGTAEDRLVAVEQFAALNETSAVHANAGMSLTAGASAAAVAASLARFAEQGTILWFDESDFLFGKRTAVKAAKLVPTSGTCVLTTSQPELVKEWIALGAVEVHLDRLAGARG